jgi:hypothetical protein
MRINTGELEGSGGGANSGKEKKKEQRWMAWRIASFMVDSESGR